MQKLVKRKMHYETIMPVEAYHPEDTSEDDINDLLLIGSCTWAILSPDPVGELFCGAAILNNLVHDEEVVDAFTGIMENAFEQAATEAQAGEAVRELASDASEGIMQGFIDWSSDIDYDDPTVQQYGE